MTGLPPLVSLDSVGVHFEGQSEPVLRDLSLTIGEGELALVVGRTGTGKSTLLGLMSGSVPHFTGGTVSGRVVVAGRDTRDHRPRDLADVVGVVGQDPLSGFVTDTVEQELAYGMEQLGLSPAVMRKRVEETLDVLGIAELRGAHLRELSGGQQQRVAIGAVLTAHPSVIILDEPTSALDPTGADDVLATITRLVHDLAVTVVVAEHRIERVAQYADTVIHVGRDGRVSQGEPAAAMAWAEVAPPVVQLGRWAGWTPLPLSIRDARRRYRQATTGSGAGVGAGAGAGATAGAAGESGSLPTDLASASFGTGPAREPARGAEPSLAASGVVVMHGEVGAVAGVDLRLWPGTVTALMGRNGAGKSSLLWALQGTGDRTAGRVVVARPDGSRVDPATCPPAQRRALVGLVPQNASDLLYLDSVAAECHESDREAGALPGSCRALLDRLAPGIDGHAHPRDLSEGQRLALVLAVQLTAQPQVMLLDEPTRGLDYEAKGQLADVLRDLAGSGRTVAVSTHDVEFAAEVSSRVVVMAAGEVVADGPTVQVVTSSPAFAPQVAKVTAPSEWLTVADVVRAFPGGLPA